MPEIEGLLALALGMALASAMASALALRLLSRLNVIDEPNARSSHRRPIPRGGGIAFMAVAITALAVTTARGDGAIPTATLLAAAAIAAASFVDDLRPLPAALRLLLQAIAVLAGILALPGDGSILATGLPVWLDRVILGLAWLWFINLFNFMDGIDGIAAGEATTIALGVAILTFIVPSLDSTATEAVIIGAAALGFLAVNWPPARLFMGDAGSIGLGYLLGWLLIEVAASGHLAAALILPLVFIADATTTLLLRALWRRPLAVAHRDHAYQTAVDRGRRHVTVTGAVIMLGLALIGLAVWSIDTPWPALVAAVVLIAALLGWFRFAQPRGSSGTSSR